MSDVIIKSSAPQSTKVPVLVILVLIIAVIFSGCSTQDSAQAYELAPISDMHPVVQESPISVQQAYQFAHANPEILQQFPCYCGCGAMGHTSNYSCYINETNGDKAFDNHALGCSICVDITQDVMRLMNDGQPIADIQGFVDNKYSAFGPSNIP